MLKRTLTYNDLLFIAIGNIIGGGVFSLMGHGIKWGSGTTWLLLLFTGFSMYIMSKAYTDIGNKINDNESEYNIAKEFGGKAFATTYSITSILTSITVATVISIAFADHAKALIPLDSKLIAVLILLIIAIINMLGIRSSTTIINGMTLIEMTSLIVLMLALPFVANKNLLETPTINKSIMVPLIMIFAFTGSEALPKLAGESINPKVIPKAIDTSIFITTIMYTMVAATMISTIGIDNISKSITPMVDTYAKLFGSSGKMVINGVALFSIFNTIMMSNISSSRSLYGLAKKKNYKLLSHINDNNVPINAIIITTCISIGLVLMTKSIEKMAIFSNLFIMIVMIVINSVALKENTDNKNNTNKSRNIVSIILATAFLIYGSKQLLVKN
jgi:basic amino acid/polyamine antiporter, APA family